MIMAKDSTGAELKKGDVVRVFGTVEFVKEKPDGVAYITVRVNRIAHPDGAPTEISLNAGQVEKVVSAEGAAVVAELKGAAAPAPSDAPPAKGAPVVE